MGTIDLESFNKNFYVKLDRYSKWEKAEFGLIESFFEDTSELTPDIKDDLPQFAFNVQEGESSIKLSYPVEYLVTEIDVPDSLKETIRTDPSKHDYWERYFRSLYHKITKDQSINYFIIYLTPSKLGLRFILHLDKPVTNKDEYITVLKLFLEQLLPYGVDEKYHDLKTINRGWYFPIYKRYYGLRGDTFKYAAAKLPLAEDITHTKDTVTKVSHNDSKINVENLLMQIEKIKIDITKDYHDWVIIGYALTSSFNEDGRIYYHRISQFHPEYVKGKCDKLYDSCLRSKGSGITLGTLFYIAHKYGLEIPKVSNATDDRFWYLSDRRLMIDYDAYFKLLYSKGIGRFALKNVDDTVFIKVDKLKKLVTQISKSFITEFTTKIIDRLNVDEGLKKDIKNAFLGDSKILMTKNYAAIKVIDIEFMEDDTETMYFFYKNCFVQIRKDEVSTHTYEEMTGFIWESQIILREFIPISVKEVKEKSEFYTFIKDVSRDMQHEEDQKRFTSLKTTIGYLLHSYKDPVVPKAIVFMDASLSEDTKGRTGKGIVKTGLGKMRKIATEHGNQFDFRSQFSFSQITLDTNILFIDDVPRRFDFEKLYSVLTEGVVVEKKYKDKFHISYENSPKILITTNYAIQGSGDSFEGRIYEYEFCDYYRYGYSPMNKFGHRLFEQWDQGQWNLFDNFMIGCCKTYLRGGLRESRFINLPLKRIIAKTGYAFVEYLKTNIEINKKYEKQLLYEEFIKENPIYKDWGRNKFTTHMKEYFNIQRMKVGEPHSGKVHYYMVTTKNSDLD